MSNGGVVYLMTSPSGRHYVGQTWDLETRLAAYKRLAVRGDLGRQPAIMRALIKYGMEKFDIKVIVSNIKSQDELNELERKFVLRYGSLAPAGYNLTTGGGEGGKVSDVTRRRMSEVKLGVPQSPEHVANNRAARLGSKASTETKKKMRAAKLGKPLSEQHCKAISISQRGKPRSPVSIAKMRKTKGKFRDENIDLVMQMLADGKLQCEVAKHLGVSKGTISIWKKLYDTGKLKPRMAQKNGC